MTPSQKSTYDCFPSASPSALTSLRGPLPTWGLSTESASQQWGLCEAIVRQAPDKQELLAPAAGLLAWAWQQRPLAAPVTTLLAALDAQQNFLGRPTRDMVRSLKKNLAVVQDKAAWQAVLDAGQWPAVEAFLLKAFSGPAALAWLGETWEELALMADHELARRLLALAAPKGPLGLRLLAELAFHQGSTDEAMALAEGLTSTPFAPFGDYLAAHMQGRAGLREQAADALAGLWRDMPWHTNLTLKLFDLARPKDSSTLPPDPTAILIYSWNKADLLRQTLESVFAGDIGSNPVFVLDNGSTDSTPDMLSHMAQQYGTRLTLVRLPVNVGAPAARNWLLSLPQVRAQAYAAFLDDDVLLPGNWLATLLAAAKSHPQCGVVGCSIREHIAPHRLQSADYHLLHRLPGPEGQAPGERVRIFDNCTAQLDLGMFDYRRPCLSVSGCCHLLNLDCLDAVGGFDVRFTPTQFDDLDRDMRSFLAGRPALYAGDLAIDHVQRSSLRQASTPAQVAHIQGNKMKLDANYPDAVLDKLINTNFELVWRDLLAKRDMLQALYLP